MKKKWSSEEEAAVIAAWNTDTVEAIAAKLGRTILAVQERSRLLGLHIREKRYIGQRPRED